MSIGKEIQKIINSKNKIKKRLVEAFKKAIKNINDNNIHSKIIEGHNYEIEIKISNLEINLDINDFINIKIFPAVKEEKFDLLSDSFIENTVNDYLKEIIKKCY